MEITTQASGNAWIVAVSGRLDTLTAPEYEKTLSTLIDDGKIHLVVDFSALTYISSAGLRALVATGKKLKKAGGNAVFAKLQESVRDVFEMTGFHTMLSLFDSVEDAQAAL